MLPPLGPFNVTTVTATYCFLIASVAPVGLNDECANMNSVRRIDIVVGAQCVARGAKVVAASAVNDVPLPVALETIDWDGNTFGLLSIKKITNTFPVIPPGGLRLCLELMKDSACPSASALCYGPSCVYHLVDSGFSCCPTGEVTDTP
ncbi:hypothetical protein PLESTB_000871700 [Pleodorina starrii]|uniref:Uncharacterized protein n=1 Tax=Pleodorina starrii TaxID=330485 RepID=A0A9W6BM13_9CHLO|nr:hypothetical protein PLESTM_002030500 [Pleodorina starrii]GLC54483.1 hypothetical protein PLESTB_000871700 [Pleodorina starrii]GLC76139.1 hypothetical protein PLESTF_001739100 [Pleodorina starrii]